MIDQHLDPYANHQLDPDHLELLRQGVDAWNENRPDRPNLAGADLAGFPLAGADMSSADLANANLSEADLSRALTYPVLT